MSKLLDYIRKNKNLYNIAKMVQLRKDEKFKQYCLDYFSNPKTIHFYKYGNENPDTLIYRAKVGNSAIGMFSLVTWTLRRLEFADFFHMKPVVIWDSCVPVNNGKIDNPFELYFKPVSDIGVEQANNSVNVAESRNIDLVYQDAVRSYNFSDDEIVRLAPIYKKYIQLTDEIEQNLESDISKLLGNISGKVIAVHVRGVDWRKMKVDGHPVASSEEFYIETVKNIMSSGQYEAVLLATDAESTVELFKEHFGDKVILYDDVIRTPKDSSSLAIFNKENDPYRLGYEVIRDVYTMAKCESLIAGVSYVSYVARIIKLSRDESFEELVIVDNGLNNTNLSLKKAEKMQKEKK